MATKDENLEFLSRQVEFLGSQGKSGEEIQALLGQHVLQVDGANLIARHEENIGNNLVLVAMTKHADRIGMSPSAIAQRYSSTLQDLESTSRYSSGSLRTLRSHVTITAIMIMLVVGTYLNYVIPAFQQLFAAMGADLPALTRLVIESASFRSLLLIAPLLAIAWVTAEEILARKILRHHYFPDNAVWRLFLLGPAIRRHFSLIRFWIMQLAIEMGKTEGQALDIADSVLSDISPQLVSEPLGGGHDTESLRIAASLGTLKNELRYRVDRLLVDLPMEATIRRDRLGLVFSLIVGFIIAILILAMYLPIFKLGSII